MLSVKEIESSDIDNILDYWFQSDPEYLKLLGVDINKLPDRNDFKMSLQGQITTSYPDKKSYCIIWMLNHTAIGHCNLNPIQYEQEAYLHLHIWNPSERQKGFGVELLKLTLPYFFNNFRLKNLFCQPNALNIAPNKTLKKAGFDFVKEYITFPGSINPEQAVKLWVKSSQN